MIAIRNYSPPHSSTKWTYSYDNRGNILSKKEYIVNVDENNESVYTEKANSNYVYDEEWKDKLTSFNGQMIAYDASGNPTNYLGHSLSWTMGRQLASYDNTTYSYNENGIRTSKTVGENTTEFYLNGTNIIYQTDGTNDIYFFYDRNNEIVGFKYSGNNYFYVKNQMGDITDIADENGNIVASYSYDPWGSVLSVTGSNTEIGDLNPFRYRSYYYDSDIQMYYLQSRYYDPGVGRFINCDDVNYIGLTESSVSYNPFAYCGNDPVNCFDADGKISIRTFLGYVILFKAVHDRFLCVRLYTWGFLHRKKNMTYDFSKKWSKLLVNRLKSSKAIKEAIAIGKKRLLEIRRASVYVFKPKINFYNYIKGSISDIDLILSIGGGGDIQITITKTNNYENGKRIYNINITLSNEKFDFGYWKMKIGKFEFGREEAHSKNQLVTLINNFGYFTQRVGAFIDYTWKFSINFSTI